MTILALLLGYFIGKKAPQLPQNAVEQLKGIYPNKKIKILHKIQPKSEREKIAEAIKNNKKVLKVLKK